MSPNGYVGRQIWEYKLPILLVTSIIAHFLVLPTPKYHVFDEVYYVKAAESILSFGKDIRPEHPPLAQLIITAGVALFGNTPFGWRIFSIAFGTIAIAFLYLLTRRLYSDENSAFAAATLFAFEYTFFTMGLLALLDVFYVTFMIIGFYFLARKNTATSATAFALGAVSKLTILFAIPVIPAYLIFRRIQRPVKEWLKTIRVKRLLVWFAVFIPAFIASLYVFDQIYTGFIFFKIDAADIPRTVSIDRLYYVDPWKHFLGMLTIHTATNWPPSTQPPPWMWIITSRNYYLGTLSLNGDIFLEGYNAMFYGLAFISIPFAFYRFWKGGERGSLLIFLWFVFTYLSWFPFFFLFVRPIFHFYIVSAVPAIAIANVRLFQESRVLMWGYVAANIFYFALYQYPIRAIGAPY